jgi:hypothetical protein
MAKLWQNYGHTVIYSWLQPIEIGSIRNGEFHAEASVEGWKFLFTWTVSYIFYRTTIKRIECHTFFIGRR